MGRSIQVYMDGLHKTKRIKQRPPSLKVMKIGLSNTIPTWFMRLTKLIGVKGAESEIALRARVLRDLENLLRAAFHFYTNREVCQ